MTIVKKNAKPQPKVSTFNIRTTEEFNKKWKAFAKENRINTSQTIRLFLEKIMNNKDLK